MKNIPLQEIARHFGVISDSRNVILGYQIDSRSVMAGDLFFALQGQKNDGHQFLSEVKKKGGIGAVVSKSYQGPDFGLDLIRVEDVLFSLQDWARYSLKDSKMQIVGITGSVGKTTVKDFAATLLEGKFRVGKNLSSHNTKITFPLTLLNRPLDVEVMVLEMGMSEPGDIRRLVSIAPPDIGLITKISLAHAAFFPGGLQQIAQGKGEIFSHPKTKIALFDHAFYAFPEAVHRISGEKVSFSLLDRSADFFLFPHENQFVIDEKGIRAHQWDLPFKQSHILHNFLAALTIARQMKMSWDEMEGQIGKLQLPKMRFEQFEKGGISFINDAYNASPESMRAALCNLPEPKEGGKRIAVLGSMKELGAFSESSHREIGLLAQKHVDHLLVLGEEAAPLCEAFLEVKKPGEFFVDSKALAERLGSLMSPGDVVLVKGSRSMKMETIFELLG